VNRTLARRVTRGLVGAAVGTLMLSSCVESGRTTAESGGGGAADTDCPVDVNEDIDTAVRIAYQPIPNGDLVVRDKGWLEACMPNADITWSKFSSGGDVIQAFGSDSVDLGLVGSSPATKAVSAPLNIDMQVIWIHDVIGEAESLVAQGGPTSVEELKGKTVAVPFASTAHFSLLSALDAAGLDPARDVELINLSPDAMLAAWERKEIDAAWVWDPTLSQLKDTGEIIASSEDTAERGTPTFDLAAAQTGFIEENPEFMEVWTAVQDAAVTLIQDDPDAAAESIAIQLGTDAEQVSAQLEGYLYLPASEQAGEEYFGGQLGQNLVATAKFLATQNEIDAVAPAATYEGAVYTEAIEAVAQ
jgi:taurine transport system substrate-binding protein